MLMGWNSMNKGWWCGVIRKLIKWISCHMTRQRFSAHLTYIGTPWKVIAWWNQNRTIAYLFMLLPISIYIPSQIFPSSLYISPFTLQLACLHSFIWGFIWGLFFCWGECCLARNPSVSSYDRMISDQASFPSTWKSKHKINI